MENLNFIWELYSQPNLVLSYLRFFSMDFIIVILLSFFTSWFLYLLWKRESLMAMLFIFLIVPFFIFILISSLALPGESPPPSASFLIIYFVTALSFVVFAKGRKKIKVGQPGIAFLAVSLSLLLLLLILFLSISYDLSNYQLYRLEKLSETGLLLEQKVPVKF